MKAARFRLNPRCPEHPGCETAGDGASVSGHRRARWARRSPTSSAWSATARTRPRPSKLTGARILVVEARYYDGIGDELLAGAKRALDGGGCELES